ncbi:MAG: glycosyltransferase [bacterium]|nr:glycosyltransferase [bacterium]
MSSYSKDLTIISVYHNRLSGRLLRLNGEITRRLNPNAKMQWLVGDNTPPGFPVEDKITAEGFTVIPNPHDYKGRGSHQHAGAINLCLSQVTTRFVMSMDSDFYILRPGWIEDILSHMQENNLAFFGVTYHPEEYVKYRYFPSVVCVIIDLSGVRREDIDFAPEHVFAVSGRAVTVNKKTRKKRIFRKRVRHVLAHGFMNGLFRFKRMLDFSARRRLIGSARDTSYAIFRRYGSDQSLGREYVQAVFDPVHDLHLAAMLPLRLNALFERLLPDQLCYVPKRRDAYTPMDFRARGFPDCGGYGWEEYIWKDIPFGIHIRGSKTWKRNQSEDEEFALIRKTLTQFIREN